MTNSNQEALDMEKVKKIENIQKTVKHADEAVTLDPQGNYFDPDKNFNDGEQPVVVMVGGKPRAVKNGVMYDVDANGKIKPIEEMAKEELDYAKENREDLQEAEGKEVDQEKQESSIIQGLKAQVNQLPEEKLIDLEE